MECNHCKKEFKRRNKSKSCSLKCKILSNIEKENECWNWMGILFPTGYGAIQFNSKSLRAHRASFEVFKGKIPDGMYVCHTCDNRKCVNPDHLWIGTHYDNMKDASKKSRLPGPSKWSKEKKQELKNKIKIPDNRGENHGLSRLKESDINDIRELLRKGLSLRVVGVKYNLSSGSVSKIKNRKSWAHI